MKLALLAITVLVPLSVTPAAKAEIVITSVAYVLESASLTTTMQPPPVTLTGGGVPHSVTADTSAAAGIGTNVSSFATSSASMDGGVLNAWVVASTNCTAAAPNLASGSANAVLTIAFSALSGDILQIDITPSAVNGGNGGSYNWTALFSTGAALHSGVNTFTLASGNYSVELAAATNGLTTGGVFSGYAQVTAQFSQVLLPAPGALALVGLAGLVGGRRRRGF